MDFYIGTILPWAGAYAPAGWAFCEGQLLPIMQNQALYAVIGTQYGGNGSNNFALPDLRGRFPIGAGQNPGTGAVWQPGTVVNSTMNITLTADNLPAHSHAITNQVTVPTGGTPVDVNLNIGIPVNTDTTNTAPVNIPAGNNCTLTGSKSGSPQNLAVNTYTTNPPTANATLKPFPASTKVNVPAPSVGVNSTCSPAGNSKQFSVQPPTLCIRFIIALQGLFPPRD